MKLFGIGKNKAERTAEAQAKAARDAANVEALQMGRDAGSAMTAAVDQFIAFRARSTGERVYGAFLHLVEEAAQDREHSPIDTVRIQQRIFVEELRKYNDRMKSECHEHVNDWLKLADQMEVRDTLELYISNKLSEIFMELFERSVNRSAEIIETLRTMGFKAILTQD